MTDYELRITSYRGIVAGATHFRGHVQGPCPRSCHGGTIFHGGGPPELRGKTTCEESHELPGRDEWDVEAAWTEERYGRFERAHYEGGGPDQFSTEEDVTDAARRRFTGQAPARWWEPDVVTGKPGDRLLYDGDVIAEIPVVQEAVS